MLVWNYRRLTDLNERRRVRMLLFDMTAASVGAIYFIAPIVITNLGLGSGLNFLFSDPTFVMAALLLIALPFSFVYAIIAQRLFDVQIIILQGLQYAFARRSILLLVLVLALAAGL